MENHAPSKPSSGQQPDLYDQPPTAEGQGETLAARKAALHILQCVFLKKHNLDQAMDESAEFQHLAVRDRAFVRMMVATVIRRLGQIDDLIRKALSRPDQPLNPPVLEQVLRLGVAQMIFMNTPHHAAVNTSVQLVEGEGHGRMKGFANAVLRRIAADGREWTTRQDIARLNTPEWLMKIWTEDYGQRHALDIGLANLHEAPLDLSLKNPAEAAHWAETLGAQILPTGSIRLAHSKPVTEMPGFEEGAWWVQDAAASIPAQLFGNIQGKTVYDICAAPGGKTAQLAAMGAHVVSIDRSAKRLTRLNENMRRLKLSDQVKTEVADAAAWKLREGADYILLDAPCSATGTIRRNPDVGWLKTASDVYSLTDLQHRLLNNALNMLNPGGILVYCTCSLQKAEGEAQIDRILEERDDIERIPVLRADVGGVLEFINPMGDLRVLPYHLESHGGIDGFFISRLTKKQP